MSGTSHGSMAAALALALALCAIVAIGMAVKRRRRDVTAGLPAMAGSDYRPWRLLRRELANPDSAGGPLFRLHLRAEGPLPQWRAGAIARVYCGPAEEVLGPMARPTHPAGDYMVGSLPHDGVVELIIRLGISASPDQGRRSRWLCQSLQPGQPVALALRDDPASAPPPDDAPLILIGNATGLAGIQAHIKARPAGTRNWLIFGDRNSSGDRRLAAELVDWVASGHLERCDLVLPGEGERPRHVTDQLEDVREPLRDWVMAGAFIHICGSTAMGSDVETALGDLLGRDVLDDLAQAGRYRSMVY